MKYLFFILIATLFLSNVNAQTLTDSTAKHSPVKTINDVQYNSLISGNDLTGMELVADLNHYPDPEKVIKLKIELALSPDQVVKIAAVSKELHRKKLEMGLIIINNEKVLDSLFQHSIVNNGSLIFYANRSGLYQGELRNAILQACLATRMLLSHQQIIKFYALQKAN